MADAIEVIGDAEEGQAQQVGSGIHCRQRQSRPPEARRQASVAQRQRRQPEQDKRQAVGRGATRQDDDPVPAGHAQHVAHALDPRQHGLEQALRQDGIGAQRPIAGNLSVKHAPQAARAEPREQQCGGTGLPGGAGGNPKREQNKRAMRGKAARHQQQQDEAERGKAEPFRRRVAV